VLAIDVAGWFGSRVAMTSRRNIPLMMGDDRATSKKRINATRSRRKAAREI
jgi:hypothetical protein